MSGQRARLFVALELPPGVRGVLLRWREPVLAAHAAQLRPVSPEALHVTLCFLGPQPVAEIEAISAACDTAAEHAAAPLALGEPVWLPPARPRGLAVALEDPQRQLSAVQVDLSAGLAMGGWYTPERRPFLPHITLARVGREHRLRPSALPPPPDQGFTAVRLTLFRSHLGAGGARYEALRRVRLRK